MINNLTMKSDIVFKAFFSRNEKYLKSFLSAILGKQISIKRIMHDVRLEQLVRESKYGILDLEVQLTDGEIVNVEMQLKNNKNIEKRTTFYASKKIVEQLEPGQDFKKMNRVIVIAILDYEITDLPEYVIETVRIARDHLDYELNNIAKYYYIELPKFRKQNPDMSVSINQWLSFIDMEREDLLDMAQKENKEIKEAVKAYDVLTGDAEVKRIAEIRLMSELEEKSALATARSKGTEEGKRLGIEEGKKKGITEGKRQGIEEGKKQGIEEGKKQGITEGKKQGIAEGEYNQKLKIAKKMLKANISIDEIAEFTDLTKDEIKKLTNK